MKHLILWSLALVLATSAAHAQVYLTPDQIAGRASATTAPSSNVYLTPKGLSAPMSTPNMNAANNPYAQQQTVGVALTAQQYNAILDAQKQAAAQQSNASVTTLPSGTGMVSTASSGTLQDDGSTYYDPATGMFMKKSAFAQQLWSRGEDPNALYPNMFPAAPARAGTLPAGTAQAGNVTWKTTMP